MENNEITEPEVPEVGEIDPTISFVDNIILGNNVKAKTDFNTILSQKTAQRIDDFKTDIAKNVFNDIVPEVPETPEIPQEPAVQEESFDVLSALQNATPQRNAQVELYSGALIDIDETTANVLIKYISTLDQDEKSYFIEDMQQNERGLFKAIEIANHEIAQIAGER